MSRDDPRRGGYVAPPRRPGAPRQPLRSIESWERDAQLGLDRAAARRAKQQSRLLPSGRALGYAIALIAAVGAVCVIALFLAIALANNVH